MGMTRVNDKQVLAPTREIRVQDLKALAGIPQHEVLYEPKSGRVLSDNDVVPTEEADYGVVADWQRG